MPEKNKYAAHLWTALAENSSRMGFSCWFPEEDESRTFERILDWLESFGGGYLLIFLRLMTPQGCQDYTEHFHTWCDQQETEDISEGSMRR